MPQKSSFFDSAPGDERYYPAREFAEYFSRFIGNGIFSGGTVLKVSANGTDANVSIALGHAWINGYKYSVYDQDLSLPVSPATTQDRIDRIILRLDISTPIRAIQALVLQGVPGSAPVAPAIVRSGSIYDLSLAQVLVKANTSVVKPENITDERLNNAVCGIVTGVVQQADTTQIFNEFQAWMNTKKAEFQSQWNQFMSDIQGQGFATADYVDQKVMTGGFGNTTNNANAYSVVLTPAPTALVAGLKITIKINAANTGPATLNVNGLGAKTIKKGSGNTLSSGNLKAGSIYTLVYDGSSSFILQGEGGEYGTALASDVMIGKTIGTENGIVDGTIINRSAQNEHQPGLETTVWPGDRFFIKPPAGWFNGSSWVTAAVPGLTAANLRSGVNVGGVIGTMVEGKEFVQGTISALANGNIEIPFVGGFEPFHVVCWKDGSNFAYMPGFITSSSPYYKTCIQRVDGVVGSNGSYWYDNPLTPNTFIIVSNKMTGVWNYLISAQ